MVQVHNDSGVSSYKLRERMETAKSERKIEKDRSKESGKEYFTEIDWYLFSLERFSAFCHFLTSPDEGRHSKCCELSSLAWLRFPPLEIPEKGACVYTDLTPTLEGREAVSEKTLTA